MLLLSYYQNNQFKNKSHSLLCHFPIRGLSEVQQEVFDKADLALKIKIFALDRVGIQYMV